MSYGLPVRASAYKGYRVNADLADRAEVVAKWIGETSVNAVIESCVRQMLTMIDEEPGREVLPKIVHMARQGRRYDEAPPRLGGEHRALVLNDKPAVSSSAAVQRAEAEELHARADAVRRRTRHT